MHTHRPPEPVHSYVREIGNGVLSNPYVRGIRNELLSYPYVRSARNGLLSALQAVRNELFGLTHALELTTMRSVLVVGVLLYSAAIGSMIWKRNGGPSFPSFPSFARRITPAGVGSGTGRSDTGSRGVGTAGTETAEVEAPGTKVTEVETAEAGTDPGGTETSTPSVDGGELLPPEEYIERMVESNDGRIMQATLVEEMDRSAATVSRYLSSMEDEGRIRRVRVGRRNLVMWPEEVDELRSREGQEGGTEPRGDVLRRLGSEDGY